MGEDLEAYKKVIDGFCDKMELVAEAIFLSGEVFFEKGELDKAKAYYERITILYSGYPDWADMASKRLKEI